LYAEHEKLLVNRGILEADLMPPGTPLDAHIVKGGSGGEGFGANGSGGGGSKRALLKTQAKAHARVLREFGVVRIDNILNPSLADSLRRKVFDLRHESEQAIAAGTLNPKAVFANVLLTHNRRDMTLPIGPEWTAHALSRILLESPVGLTVESILGKQALLREWSCLISDPQSQRQVVHPDTPWQPEPVLYTCFLALQDVTMDMGPTTWLPETHTQPIHKQFQDESGPKDHLLATTPNVLGILPKGACAIFDSRLLHCGGSNKSDQSRALLYCSFQNPQVVNPGNPGSIRSDLIGKWTLQDLCKELQAFQKGKASLVVDTLG
jgi:ectoine hydroxylase-related dioxygenase (phytanoyl-CoA dioxygenase family)